MSRIIALVLCGFMLAGCQSLDIGPVQQATDAIVADIRLAQDELASLREAYAQSDDPERSAEIRRDIERMEEFLARAESRLADGQKLLDHYAAGGTLTADGIADAARDIAPYLPAPIGTAVALAGIAFGAWQRGQKAKVTHATEHIVAEIETAKKLAPEKVAELLDGLDRRMDADDKALVRKLRGEK